MSSEEIFTINSAAKMTGFTAPTIRKKLPDLIKAGAIQVDGYWEIPLSALYSTHLMSKVEGKGDVTLVSKTLLTDTHTEIDDLRLQLAAALQRALVAESIAEEREKSLQRADRALLMLESRSPLQSVPTPIASHWWRRR